MLNWWSYPLTNRSVVYSVDNSGVDSTALIPFAFLSTLDHLALDFSKNQNQNQNCIYC